MNLRSCTAGRPCYSWARRPCYETANIDRSGRTPSGFPSYTGRGGCIVTCMQFAPSVYEHAARVIARSPGTSRGMRVCWPGPHRGLASLPASSIVVGIDIYNLEAEAYGAVVSQASGNGIRRFRSTPFHRAELIALEPFDPKSAAGFPWRSRRRARGRGVYGADVACP